MSFNMHCSPLAIKREPFDSSVTIKLEALESPKKSLSKMHHMPSATNDLLNKCKKRVNFSKMNYVSPHTPQPSVARRNERERNRVKMVNMGFATLRQHVPNGAKNKKMSKVETLRSAVEYIRQLQRLLGQNTENSFLHEQYDSLLQLVDDAPSSDENCYPSPAPSSHHMESPMDGNSNHQLEQAYQGQVPYPSLMGAMYSAASSELCNKLNTYNLTSPQSVQMAARTSPSPSVGSDITSSSSPYGNHSLLDTAHRQTASVAHEDELFDFSSWF